MKSSKHNFIIREINFVLIIFINNILNEGQVIICKTYKKLPLNHLSIFSMFRKLLKSLNNPTLQPFACSIYSSYNITSIRPQLRVLLGNGNPTSRIAQNTSCKNSNDSNKRLNKKVIQFLNSEN